MLICNRGREILSNVGEIFEALVCCCTEKLRFVTFFMLLTGFFIGFLILMVLPIESEALLVRIDTEIWFRESCAGGKLLDVSENLTFSLESGFTTKVQRVLHNQ